MRQDKRELYCFEGLVKLAISVIIYCIFIILIISNSYPSSLAQARLSDNRQSRVCVSPAGDLVSGVEEELLAGCDDYHC